MAIAKSLVRDGGQCDSCSLDVGFPYEDRGMDDRCTTVVLVVRKQYIESPFRAARAKVEDNVKEIAPTA